MKKIAFTVVSIVVVLALGIGALALLRGAGLGPFGDTSESRNTQVIQSITREQEVVLLSLGIQGIAEESVSSTFFGMEVPGSGRSLFLQYTYSAKLGVDGSQVKIKQLGEKAYQITVPQFSFLGHSDVEFKTVVENNGAISFTTPEIDVPKVITEILDEPAKEQHIADNYSALKEQCALFYSGIVKGVDPEIEVSFVFQGDQS